MKLSKQNRKTLASIINDAKKQAVNNYSGYELIAQIEIINWIQESLFIELNKNHSLAVCEKFIEDASEVEDETTN